jgi:hypothetical protein
MKETARKLKEYIKADFNTYFYISLAFVLIFAYYANYSLGFEKELKTAYFSSPLLYLFTFLFFGIFYYLILLLESFFRKDYSPFKEKKFIAFSLFAIIIISIDVSSYDLFYRLADSFGIPYEYKKWANAVSANFKRIIFLGLCLYIFKLIADKNEKGFYGLFTKNINLKPYILMLLAVIPLVIAASFNESFLVKYPMYKPWMSDISGNLNNIITAGIFEISYASRFISVELFFRGFLIIGLSRLIGTRALWPMVVIYGFWHFGKPMPEAISSVFGGYVLGVIALNTKSVKGGILIHMGVALSMEFFAYIRHYII